MADELTPRDRYYEELKQSGQYIAVQPGGRSPWFRRGWWWLRGRYRAVRSRYLSWRHPRWLYVQPEFSIRPEHAPPAVWEDGGWAGAVVLWAGWGGGAIWLEKLPLSPELKEDLSAWTFEYDGVVWDDPLVAEHEPAYWRDYLERGRLLHRRVREELGPDWRVDWHDPWPT